MGFLYLYVLVGCILFPVLKHVAFERKRSELFQIRDRLSVLSRDLNSSNIDAFEAAAKTKEAEYLAAELAQVDSQGLSFYQNDQDLLRYLCVSFVSIIAWSFCEWIPFFPVPDLLFSGGITFLMYNPYWSNYIYANVLMPVAVSQEGNIQECEEVTSTLFKQGSDNVKTLLSQYKKPLYEKLFSVFPMISNFFDDLKTKPVFKSGSADVFARNINKKSE